MLKFKDFEYTTFKENGFESATFVMGRDIYIEYEGKTKEDIPKLIFDMLVDAHKGSVLEVLRSQNILFQASYFYDDGTHENENMVCFLSTPENYPKVFDVKA